VALYRVVLSLEEPKRKKVRIVSRYKKEHSYEDVGIPLICPIIAKKTVITDTETGNQAKGYDWSSFRKSDSEAFENLKKKNR